MHVGIGDHACRCGSMAVCSIYPGEHDEFAIGLLTRELAAGVELV